MTATVVGVAQQGTASQARLVVRVLYYRRTEELVPLHEAALPVDATERARALSVDLLPCLRDPLRIDFPVDGPEGGEARAAAAAAAAAQPEPGLALRCHVVVQLMLVREGAELDRVVVGPLVLAPGARTEVEAPPLFAGITAPTAQAPQGAVAVDFGLVRAVVRATDADGNLQGLGVDLTDAQGATLFDFLQLPEPAGELHDTLYLFANLSSGSLGALRVRPVDTKGAFSTLLVPIAFPPTSAPSAGQASAAVSGENVTVTFSLFDQQGDATTVEVLFRSAGAQGRLLEALAAPPCVRAIPPGTGAKSVVCPRPGQGFAQVLVIPFDLGPGQAARSAVVIP